MADTPRTKSGLQTVLATNGVQGLSAQDVRDFLVSIMGVYAQLYVSGGVASQSMGTSPAKLTLWAADGEEDLADADYTNDQIEIGALGDGVYLALAQFSFSGAVSTTFTLKLAVNGTEDDAIACSRKLGTGGDDGSCSFVGLVSLSDGDIVTVYCTADGVSKSFTLAEAQLVLRRIA